VQKLRRRGAEQGAVRAFGIGAVGQGVSKRLSAASPERRALAPRDAPGPRDAEGAGGAGRAAPGRPLPASALSTLVVFGTQGGNSACCPVDGIAWAASSRLVCLQAPLFLLVHFLT
jgi:hypothetical protein